MRSSVVHWNGTHWVNCPLNFENTAGPRGAKGNTVYNYCDGVETGAAKHAVFDIGGKTMSSVYAGMGTGLTIADPTVLANATFPSGATLTYQRLTALTGTIGYSPGISHQIRPYRAGVPAGVAPPCLDYASATRTATAPSSNANTLEALITSRNGLRCQSTMADGTAVPGDSYRESVLPLDTYGNAVPSGSTAPSNAGSRTGIYIAFKGAGINAVTYHQGCASMSASATYCPVIGTGSYTISTRGDARILTLNNLPVTTAGTSITRVFVERGGFVYTGYQTTPGSGNSARLNSVGVQALLTQLGVAPVDPEVPLALTLGSYQGYWIVNDATRTDLNGRDLIDVIISPSGAIQCLRDYAPAFTCTLTFTNISTGDFTVTGNNGLSGSGRFDFTSGTGGGAYRDPSSTTPRDGQFLAQRG